GPSMALPRHDGAQAPRFFAFIGSSMALSRHRGGGATVPGHWRFAIYFVFCILYFVFTIPHFTFLFFHF
ncbi:MAG: hypothetical protein K2M09_07615, partial [Muribaculaceae bacterium]|nr:hypothetical protein [Muribaculaceae bacterium]